MTALLAALLLTVAQAVETPAPEPTPELTPPPVPGPTPEGAAPPTPTATPSPVPAAPVDIPAPAPVATPPDPVLPEPSRPEDAPRVHLDCRDGCDLAYLQREVGFVRFVLDRADADVHVLVTTRGTAAGGLELTLGFTGMNRLDGLRDAIVFFTPPQATEDLQRSELARILRVGLARYAARTGTLSGLDVAWTAPPPGEGRPDPWQGWIFTISGSGNFRGESAFRSDSLSGSFNAGRVTDLWKFRLGSSIYTVADRYEIRFADDSGDVVTDVVKSWRRDVSASGLLARGVGEHAAFGVRTGWSTSTYTNYDMSLSGAAVAEWSVFPYAESSTRSLVFQYIPGATYADYERTTIYGKDEEVLSGHLLRTFLSLTRPWGSVTLSFDGHHHFHDIESHALSSWTWIDLRIVRGLALTVSASGALIHNRRNIARAGATREEVLLQRRQLETSYSYSTSVGLTWRFGSIYTPVVNTRLEPQ